MRAAHDLLPYGEMDAERLSSRMFWQSIAAGTVIVVVPTLGTNPRVARFLVDGPGSRWAAYIAAGLAAVGAASSAGGAIHSRAGIVLAAPLLQLALLHVLYRFFRRVQGREPADVAFNWAAGLGADRLYALTLVIGGIVPFIFVLAPRS